MKKTLLCSITLILTLLCTACANEQADSGNDAQSTAASGDIAQRKSLSLKDDICEIDFLQILW